MAQRDLCGSLDSEDWEALGHLVAHGNDEDPAYADAADAGTSDRDQASPDQPSQGKLIECRVCSIMDSKVTSNFGVVSCIPCRSFFARCLKKLEQVRHKRCISGKQRCKISYGNLDCTICRLKKCLKTGMWKGTMEDPYTNHILSMIFRRCCVCGSFDKVTRSCGPRTCESCVDFFKLKSGAPLTCSDRDSNEECVINVRTRDQCASCRMLRCLTMGMSTEKKGPDSSAEQSTSAPEQKVSPLRCSICGDSARCDSKPVSCLACKRFFTKCFSGFFSPSKCVDGKGRCKIHLDNRNRCRYCRLQKCLRKGMVAPLGREDAWARTSAPSGSSVVAGRNSESSDRVDESEYEAKNSSDPDLQSQYASTSREARSKSWLRLCSVCNSAKGVGRSYNIDICMSCRAFYQKFYKQSRSAANLRCLRGTKDCVVDIDKLPHCAFCRFTKFVDLGAKPIIGTPTTDCMIVDPEGGTRTLNNMSEQQDSTSDQSYSSAQSDRRPEPMRCLVCRSKKSLSNEQDTTICESCRKFYLKYRERRTKRCITGRKNCRVHFSDRNRCKSCRLRKCRKVELARVSSIRDRHAARDLDIPEVGVSRGSVHRDVEDIHDADADDDGEDAVHEYTRRSEDRSSHLREVKREVPEATRECVVCHAPGDSKAISKSYSVLTCRSCVVFYSQLYKLKRPISRLRCRLERGNCDVDYRSKPLCPYCRFRRFVDQGARTDPRMMISQSLRVYERRASYVEPPETGPSPRPHPQRICSVCGGTRNVQLNRSYGVICCMACKMFFVQYAEQRTLRCVTGREDCSITSENRKSCRYCRLAKCLAVGMKRDVATCGLSDLGENQTNENVPTTSGAIRVQEEAYIDQSVNNEPSSVTNRSVSGQSAPKCGVCGASRNIKKCCDRLVCIYCKLFYLRFYKSSRPIESLQCLKKSRDCVINQGTPFCEYCRFKKCLQIGMRTQPNMKIPESFVSPLPDAISQQVAGDLTETDSNSSPEQTDNEPRFVVDLPETPSAGAAVIQQQLAAAARRRAANSTVTSSRGLARKSTATRDPRRGNQSKLKSNLTDLCAELARTSSTSPVSSLRMNEGAMRQHRPLKVVVVTAGREASEAISEVSPDDSNSGDLVGNEAAAVAGASPTSQDIVNRFASCSYSVPRTSQHGLQRNFNISNNHRATVARSEMETNQARVNDGQDHQQVAKRPTTRVGRSLGLKLFTQLSNQESDNQEQEFETLTTYSYELNHTANNVPLDNGLSGQSTASAGDSTQVSPICPNDLNPVLTITLKTNKIVIDRRPMLHKRLKVLANNGNTRVPFESESLIGPGEDCDESDREEFIEIDCDA